VLTNNPASPSIRAASCVAVFCFFGTDTALDSHTRVAERRVVVMTVSRPKHDVSTSPAQSCLPSPTRIFLQSGARSVTHALRTTHHAVHTALEAHRNQETYIEWYDTFRAKSYRGVLMLEFISMFEFVGLLSPHTPPHTPTRPHTRPYAHAPPTPTSTPTPTHPAHQVQPVGASADSGSAPARTPEVQCRVPVVCGRLLSVA
jgi:hypothetical protein